MTSSSAQESTQEPSVNKKRGKSLEKRTRHDLVDISKPCEYLLGWHDQHWEKVCEPMLTHAECCRIIYDKGMAPYTKFMVVSPSELAYLGMPQDEAASDFFSLTKQREVSLRNHSGKRATTKAEYRAVVDRITDPRGE